MKTGRNDPCPCGSGKKFKQCCEGTSVVTRSFGAKSGPIIAATFIVAAGAIAAGLSLSKRDAAVERVTGQGSTAAVSASDPSAPSSPKDVSGAPITGTATAPPGPAPAGKVWSPEHKHWHDQIASVPVSPIDVSGGGPFTVTTTPGAPPPSGLGAPPPGPAPAGKVWSPEHKHWHDQPAKTTSPVDLQKGPARATMDVEPPAGPAPVGKVWSREHGHFHDARGTAAGSATPAAQPRSTSINLPPPTRRVWSKEHNHWHNVPAN